LLKSLAFLMNYQFSSSTPPPTTTTTLFSHREHTTNLPVSSPSPHQMVTSSVHHMRLALTITHLLLVSLGKKWEEASLPRARSTAEP
jgi:hypothetical protein